MKKSEIEEVFINLSTNGKTLTFGDFKKAIVNYRVSLMRGLDFRSPDFNSMCKELFSNICKSTVEVKSERSSSVSSKK
jgi:hypothetical protein